MQTPTIDPDQWLTTLRENGCRVTDVQEMLIHILACAESPFTAKQVWEEVCQMRPETGRATVNRTFEKLERLKLLRRIHGYHGCSHFIPTQAEQMMLFICLECGAVDYLDYEPMNALVGAAEKSSGHRITESRLQLFGTCMACQRND